MNAILWSRLDTPGHDACRLRESDAGWQLDGSAAFVHEGLPAQLAYSLTCDRAWHTRRGQVSGWIGSEELALDITRSADGIWTCNGAVVPGLGDCVDLDLGFTPAANLSQLRRIALAEGQGADVPAAWLDVSTRNLEVLLQRYERRSASTYWYEAPRFNYAALLEVDAVGFVRRYPGLWEASAPQRS